MLNSIWIFTCYILQHVVAEHGTNKTLNIDPAEPVSFIGSIYVANIWTISFGLKFWQKIFIQLWLIVDDFLTI